MTLALVAGALAARCAKPSPDAYGNVEATDVVVGAEAGGQLVSFDVDEGQQLAAGTRSSARSTRRQLELAARPAARAARRHRLARQRGRPPDRRRSRRSATPRSPARRGRAQAPRSRRSVEIARRAYERDAASLRPAGGDRAAARSGRARRTACSSEQIEGAGRADRGAGAPGRRADRADRRHARAAPDRDHARSRSADAQVAPVDERIRKSADQQSDRRHGARDLRASRRVRAGRAAALQDRQPRGRSTCAPTSPSRSSRTVQRRRSRRRSRRRRRGRAPDAPRHGVVDRRREAEFTPTPIQTRDERADLVYAIKIRVAERRTAC